MVLLLLKSTDSGLARFQIAERLGIPDHWCSSTVDALIKMGKIEEHSTRTVVNPKSMKTCAVLVWIDSGEMEKSA
jgi:predicted transcriptional regulator